MPAIPPVSPLLAHRPPHFSILPIPPPKSPHAPPFVPFYGFLIEGVGGGGCLICNVNVQQFPVLIAWLAQSDRALSVYVLQVCDCYCSPQALA